MNRHFLYLSTLIVPLSPVKLLGGEYSQDFSEEIIDTSLFGGDYTPYLDSDYLVLTQDGRHGSNYWKLPLLDEGTSITEFNVEFDLQISGSGGLSDGFSITFGTIPDGAVRGEIGFAQPQSLVIGWDTYSNGGEGTSVEIFSNQNSIANHPHNFGTTRNIWTPVVISWKNNMLTVSYNGTLIAENLPTDGFEPKAGDRFAFAASAGLDSQSTYIDNVAIRTGPLVSHQIIEGNFTWHEAKADAEAKGGRLAVLDTQEKIDAANAYLEERGEWPATWFGLADEAEEGDWRWITGEPLTVNAWHDGEPSNAGPFGPEHHANFLPNRTSWNDSNSSSRFSYLLEILDGTPAAPFIALDPFYESPSGETIIIDATPTIGFPAEFTYQWCFNGFKIPANFGGTASSINIDNLPANEGTWSVTVTNETGSTESSFEYRVYVDTDNDGLSDAFEELISQTDINENDTDDDGLSDAQEFNTYRTNPNSPDSDSDGFTDRYEIETAYDPNSADSVPDAIVNVMTAIEVKFNAALGATYAIEFSTDSQNWSVIEDDIIGEGGAVERLYSKQDYPKGFFRVERKDN